MKKVLALVLSALLVLALVGTALAADPNTTVTADPNVSVTGLDAGDTVNLYRVLEWEDGIGWKLTTAFASLSSNATIQKIIANDKTAALTKEDVEAIANIAKGLSTPDYTGNASGSPASYSVAATLGMYVALVEPTDVSTVYNPMIVSADLTAGGSNTIDSSEKIASSSVAKKETITLEKTTEDVTLDAGETVKFTIETTIPAYAASYTTDVKFELHDKMSTGLEYDHGFTVTTSPSVGYTGEPAVGDAEFTLKFNGTDIINAAQEVSVKVEYYAKITNAAPYSVNEETNEVEVKFSNNPDDDTKHGHLYDEVKEYTFTIDGTLFGDSDYETGEIVKVGLNEDGSIATSYVKLDNGSEHAALKDAIFGVYTDKDEADAASANYYTNSVFNGTVTTDAQGLMTIKGLDEGTYYIKELSAPAGYVKDSKTHSFTITATTEPETFTKTLEDGCTVSYEVEVLKSYKVAFDGTDKTSYEMTLSGPSIKSVTPYDSSSEIVNTKGLELPSTGGIGTTIFYVAGLMMVLGASAILVARRKADAE